MNESLNKQRWALVLADAAGSRRSLTQLHDGLAQLRRGATDLATGAQQTSHGADTLSRSAARLDQRVEQLSAGAKELGGGLDLLEQALPASTHPMDGNAQGLASSVQLTVEVVAAVQNNGSAFAGNVVPGALWLGPSLAAF